MSTTVLAISSNLIKKGIPFYAPNSRTTKASKGPAILFSYAIPAREIMNDHVHDKSNLVSLVAQLLVNNQSNPPEIPGNTPPEFPRQPDYDPPSVPPEIPEVPKPGPDFPGPPLPSPPTRPDIPLPPSGPPRPPPPDQQPPRLAPDPDISPPPNHPPPDVPPDIKPPTGPYVV